MPKCTICDKELNGSQRRYCKGTCTQRGNAETQRVSDHRTISLGLGLRATLVIDEWLAHLRYFQWMCAYCQKRPATDIDHFIPPGYEGGTTASNCVPCCNPCNTAKSSYHPERKSSHVDGIPSKAQASA